MPDEEKNKTNLELKEKINKINFRLKNLEKEIYIQSKKEKLQAEKTLLRHLKKIGYDLTKEEDFKLLIGAAFFIRNSPNPKNKELTLHCYQIYENKIKNNNKNK